MTRRFFSTMLGAVAPVLAQGQGGGPPVERLDVIPAGRMPGSMPERFQRLGQRLQKPENSRVVYSGTLRDSIGERAIEMTIQNPNHVRIVEAGTPPRTISFNGERANATGGPASAFQEKLLETILLDSPEAIFQLLANGEAYQKLGGRFRLTDRPTPATREEYVDLYRIFPRGASSVALAKSGRTKTFGFDSESGLLRLVMYSDRDGIPVLVEFEDWRRAGSERFPALIRRRERGTEVLSIRIQSIQLGPRASAASF